MLNTIEGFKRTEEAARVTAAIQQRAAGAAFFETAPTPNKPENSSRFGM